MSVSPVKKTEKNADENRRRFYRKLIYDLLFYGFAILDL